MYIKKNILLQDNKLEPTTRFCFILWQIVKKIKTIAV